LFLAAFQIISGQTFTTPNTGVTWTLDDIAAASPTTITVSGNTYTLWENLIVSENDTVLFNKELTLAIDADLLITVFGAFKIVTSGDIVRFTALDQNTPYKGFRFEEFSDIELRNAIIEYGGGLRVLTETFYLSGSMLENNVAGATTSAVVQLSRGNPEILNNSFINNDLPAIGSAANAQVSARIETNYLRGNNQENSNRPQINLGVTQASEGLLIKNNTIIGDPALDMVGGIAVANFVGGSLTALIEGNIIQNNRYGITIIGPSDMVWIRDNVIEDNNTQGDPMLGGSGISLNTNVARTPVLVSGNEFRRNLWGITVIDQAVINMGDDDQNPGGNIFSKNANGGETFALYNNTANTVLAKHNCWIEGQLSTVEQVEDVIFHKTDDPTLGEVIFEPFICSILGVGDYALENFSFYPNPVENQINFNNLYSLERVEIYGVQGNLISAESISEGLNRVSINLASGLYFVKFSNKYESITKKMMVE
ncbi:MAG TPA: T9SS type A sorting domain-containing protein, partial [Aequorivita sp.]|nr:T9SS type A sorting domain-containing protein [Aequorivita sp.]